MNTNRCDIIGTKVAVVDGVINVVDADGSMSEVNTTDTTFTYDADGALSFSAAGLLFSTRCDPAAPLQTFTITDVVEL